MRWVGGTSIFAFNKARSASGMMAANCVTDIPLGHVVLTNGDVVLFNSSEEKSILDGRMKRYLFSTIDSTNYKRSFVVSNIIDSEVLICYPTSGNTDCDRAIVWNWKTGGAAQPDWESVPVKGRRIRIVFDADAATSDFTMASNR